MSEQEPQPVADIIDASLENTPEEERLDRLPKGWKDLHPDEHDGSLENRPPDPRDESAE